MIVYAAFPVTLLTIKREYIFDSTLEHRNAWKYYDYIILRLYNITKILHCAPHRHKILYRSSWNWGSREIRVIYAKTKESCRTCTWHRDKSSPFNVHYMRGSYCRYAKCRCAFFQDINKLKKVRSRYMTPEIDFSHRRFRTVIFIGCDCDFIPMFNNIDKSRHNNITCINM